MNRYATAEGDSKQCKEKPKGQTWDRVNNGNGTNGNVGNVANLKLFLKDLVNYMIITGLETILKIANF